MTEPATRPLLSAYAVGQGKCGAWDGAELVCDLQPGHAPALPRTCRAHVLIDGRGPFRTVYFDPDRHREPVMEQQPEDVGAPVPASEGQISHREWLDRGQTYDRPPTAWGCTQHKPEQHRDRRPPWCNVCGRTADGSAPTAPPADPDRPIPPEGTRVREQSRSGRAGYSMGPDDRRPGHVLVDWDNSASAHHDSVHVSKLNVLPFPG